MKQAFIKSANIFRMHHRKNWVMNLFFINLAIIVPVVFIIYLGVSGTHDGYEGKLPFSFLTILFHSNSGGTNGGGGIKADIVIFSLLINLWLPIIMISVSSYFVLVHLFKEIKTGEIVTWVTLPIKKSNLFYSKFVYFISIMFLVWFPTFITTVSFTLTRSDASDWIFAVIISNIEIFLFCLFIMGITMIITYFCGDNITLATTIIFIFVAYIILINVINLFVSTWPDSENVQSVLKYFSIQSLCLELVKVPDEVKEVVIAENFEDPRTGEIGKLIAEVYIPIKKPLNSLALLYLIPMSVVPLIISEKLLSNKDLNI